MSSKFSCFVIILLFVPLFTQCKALQLLEQQPQATQQDVNDAISETTSLVRLIYTHEDFNSCTFSDTRVAAPPSA